MTIPRRTLLTRIAAALAALSAPVVALGAGRRRAKRRMGSAKGLMWVAPDFDAEANAPADWARAENEKAWARERDALHALLAEARGWLPEMGPLAEPGASHYHDFRIRLDAHLGTRREGESGPYRIEYRGNGTVYHWDGVRMRKSG